MSDLTQEQREKIIEEALVWFSNKPDTSTYFSAELLAKTIDLTLAARDASLANSHEKHKKYFDCICGREHFLVLKDNDIIWREIRGMGKAPSQTPSAVIERIEELAFPDTIDEQKDGCIETLVIRKDDWEALKEEMSK